jgi:5,10-methylenetetrahydromethanopterin reductase
VALATGLLVLPYHAPDRFTALARLAERTGYDVFWVADERFFREVYAELTLAATVTERLRLGPCVTDPYTRHPALTAMAIATLDELSGGRAVLGLGAGVAGFRELGIARERPAVALGETVQVIDRLIAGETVTFKGEVVSLEDCRLDFRPLRRHVPTCVASQHRLGCLVAGRVADAAMMQGCVAAPLLRFFRETVHEGARQAGRDPAAIDLVARVNVCIAEDRRAARDLMKPGIVRSLVAQRPEFFTFTQAGLTVPPGLRDRVMALPYTHDAGPLAAVAPEVPDELVDAVTLAGPPGVVAEGVIRLARGGITEMTIFPMALDGRVETTIERFQAEVMPAVRRALATEEAR